MNFLSRFGQIDYRVILDDHKARDELERLRRVDRNRRRRDPTTPSVHECIADSIAQSVSFSFFVSCVVGSFR